MTPPALTLHQPWASLVALGVKTIETRSWSTAHRGPLLIHAAKARPDFSSADIRKACAHWGIGCWEQRPDAIGGSWLCCVDDTHAFVPRGAIVASCTLADVVPITEEPDDDDTGWPPARRVAMRAWDAAGSGWAHAVVLVGGDQPLVRVEQQTPYGDFTPGRFAWLLEDVKATTERCPACWGEGERKVPIVRVGGSYPDPRDRTITGRCPTCAGSGLCDPIPAKGHQRLWELRA